MQTKYRLGDGLLTTSDLEAMNKDDFTTVGAFVQEFKKKERKVHGISEEDQCTIFLWLLTASEAAELTSHGRGNEKLTWATIDKGVAEGSMEEVEQYEMRLQRRKRKERDATASGTPRGNFDQIDSLNPAENEDVVQESQDDEFEEGEIKEAFRAEEYDGIHLKLRLLLSLRGAGRFIELIAQIRSGARTWPKVEARMQELRPSPVGPDGRPIRLEIGNVEDFIPAFEQFMHGQGILRDEWARTLPLWTKKTERLLVMQVKDMVRDWESCRAHLREKFDDQSHLSPESRDSRGARGRGTLSLERPGHLEGDERHSPDERRSWCLRLRDEGLILSAGWGQWCFITSPREEMPLSGEPLQKLEAHLDVSQWIVPPMSERRDEPEEEVPREEAQDPEREVRPSTERGHVIEEMKEVEEDTPPHTPAVGLRLGSALEGAHDREEESRQKEIPLPPPEMVPSPGVRVEMEEPVPMEPPQEEPVPMEPPQEPRQAEREMGAKGSGRADHRTRERVPAGETTEEKRVRVGKRLEKI
ncbi:hypothetical protein CBR_g34992 [Chara braunii]|uniref:Uncharacterized protein n=1 Tax=Chara braunii TaxID=69332 RepID=A0A388LK66_CHABU|nr:hypothetical protein CBR_g34992 [Chara braunii]|eukprot:GBG82622.1 hypothetical protein CBR_g34992 [Chara braunii]